MNLVWQFLFLCPLLDKPLDIIQLTCTPSLESTRVMENKTLVASKDHFILNIVKTSLN